jgi:hypothetical protein
MLTFINLASVLVLIFCFAYKLAAIFAAKPFILSFLKSFGDFFFSFRLCVVERPRLES